MTGTAGLAFGESTSWSLLVLGVGLVAGVAVVARERIARKRMTRQRLDRTR